MWKKLEFNLWINFVIWKTNSLIDNKVRVKPFAQETTNFINTTD